MKIRIDSDVSIHETEINIRCNHLTPEIEKIITMLRMLDMQLIGVKDGETFVIDLANVLYVESVDKKSFIYTTKDTYETNLKLYELEERLVEEGFFRASKSLVISFKHITSLKSDIERKIRVTLSNGEQLIVSRQYADALKQRLGVK